MVAGSISTTQTHSTSDHPARSGRLWRAAPDGPNHRSAVRETVREGDHFLFGGIGGKEPGHAPVPNVRQ